MRLIAIIDSDLKKITVRFKNLITNFSALAPKKLAMQKFLGLFLGLSYF